MLHDVGYYSSWIKPGRLQNKWIKNSLLTIYDVINVFGTGYFSNEEATASTLSSEGWLRTGDLCYVDDDGFIFVVDRLKELIKYKGYQVIKTRS